MSKIKNCGLDQYGAEPFEQKQFGTAGVLKGLSPSQPIEKQTLYYTLTDFNNYSSAMLSEQNIK